MEIENLELKLEGKLPVTREELLELIDSWGREESFFTNYDGIFLKHNKKEINYNLSNLDVSKITNLSQAFRYSYYNGDISKWNVSSYKDMNRMFSHSNFNNDSLNHWNVSNVENMAFLFYKSEFNGNISSWNISNCLNCKCMFESSFFYRDISKWKFHKDVDCDYIFYENSNFINKYNNNEEISNDTKDFLKWFKANRINIENISISKEDILDIDNYLTSFNSEKELNKG